MKSYIRIALCLLLVLCTTAALAACSGGSWRDDLTSTEVSATVTSAVAAPDGFEDVTAGYINASLWGEKHTDLTADLQDHVILISGRSDRNVDEIGVLRVKDGGDVKAAKAIVEDYVKAQALRHKSLLESYNPAELPKTENARVTVCGRYILYTILGDTETTTAHEAFENALKVAE